MENKNKDEVKIEVALPEFDREDIKVKLSKNVISIRADKTVTKKIQKRNFLHEEKTARTFSYATTVPAINPKESRINFKKGILRINAEKE